MEQNNRQNESFHALIVGVNRNGRTNFEESMEELKNLTEPATIRWLEGWIRI